LSTSLPTFVVVGHVNKGKSSVVATLLEDPSIPIDLVPGTTTAAASYDFRADGQPVFRLMDTPGFQEAAAALAWLEAHATSVAERPAALRAFVQEFADGPRFHDEVELLRPLLADGPIAILYVVDASRPYRATHEAEMEILRWSGRPGMALLNRIGVEDHRAAWEPVLQQFFSVVRPFDAHRADPEARLALLKTFAALSGDAAPQVEAAVATLRTRWQSIDHQADAALAAYLCAAWSHVEVRPYTPDAPAAALEQSRREVQQRYEKALRRLEQEARQTVEGLYGFDHLEADDQPLDLIPQDLFDRQSWRLFGLSQTQLTARAAAAGGATGGVIDLFTGGLSFGAGVALGASVGAAGAWFGSQRVAKHWTPQHTRLARLFPGEHGHLLAYGPVRNQAFAWILLDRALRHRAAVRQRAHAQQGQLLLSTAERNLVQTLPTETQAAIGKVLSACQKAGQEGHLLGEPQRTALGHALAQVR